MITLKRTNPQDPDFQNLVVKLDHYLSIIDGEEHLFYKQFNKTDELKFAVVAYLDDHAVGCGAIKPYAENTMEVKRMFVDGEVRGKGIATLVLQELERWAKELAIHACVLETGAKQADAVRLYQKNGYHFTPNYGQYQGVESSVCFEKKLTEAE
ncbi:MAG: GNAT family N-acetyltransferase [Burkholderiales bacterium]|nr:GNAT family N-acetyltransferase [Burkholderiales bacterium]